MTKKAKKPADYDYRRREDDSKKQFALRMSRYGWTTSTPSVDNGQDFHVQILRRKHERTDFDSTGLMFHVQLKSTDDLNSFIKKRKPYLSYGIEVKNLLEWNSYSTPVVIVLWDTEAEKGHWVLAKDAIQELDKRQPKWKSFAPDHKVSIRLPLKNTTDDKGLNRLRWQLGDILVPQVLAARDLTGGSVTIAIPSTDTAKLEEYNNFVAHGTPLQLHKTHFTDFQLPDILDDFYGGDDFSIEQLTIEPVPPPHLLHVTFEVETNNNKRAKFENLEFRTLYPGKESHTLSNQHQPGLVNFILQVPIPEFALQRQEQGLDSASVFTFKTHGLNGNVVDIRNIFVLHHLMEHGGVLRMILLDHGQKEIDLQIAPVPSFEPLLPEFSQFLDNLCKIQEITRVRLRFSNGLEYFTEDEYLTSQSTVELLETGKTTIHAHKHQLTMRVLPGRVEHFIESVAKGEQFRWGIQGTDITTKILGTPVNLGRSNVFIDGEFDGTTEEYIDLIQHHNYQEPLVLPFKDVEQTIHLLPPR